ncbi:mechanosensitive ion channel family protein [Haloechinothrix sp. LS1_15]|uniref:mechanosensitive ion channel family protein n=1 Tax=Haloechinothrix sp. LS1_15 TaxID=2652248 RepID=UPI002947553E|nr:mechanosensitive ion channel family protein [Haloechinothrix sp. LS1_15]MDV6011992.1 mechanosensitive ion channel family protein [Haloechinothrix sp. LS1_15]
MNAFLEQPACAEERGTWCANVYELTGHDWLAASADWLIAKPLKILLILGIAFLIRFALHRVIGKVTTPPPNGESKSPALLRSLRERSSVLNSDTLAERRRQRAATIGSVLKSITSFVVFLIAAMLVLSELGINLGPILASAGVVGVAVGFGAQNLVRDFLSGIFMMVEDQYGVGDYIDAGEAEGTVETVGLRVTTLRDINGTVWYVRNGEIMRVGNYSQSYAVAVVNVPLAYNSNIDGASELLATVAQQVTGEDPVRAEVLEAPEVLGVTAMTPEYIQLRLTVKVKPGSQWMVQRALHGRITTALAEAGFERPMPRIFGGNNP